MVTIFDSLFSDKPTYSEAHKVLKAFSVRGKNYNTIKRIRESEDKAERDELKKTLPIVCFGGKFSERKKTALEKASELIVLDFDDGKDLKNVREKMQKWNCTYSCFSSPSGGDRFKALVRIPEVIGDEEYKSFFDFFEKNYSVDKSGKDINRSCFISYDPEIYINPNAKVFTREMLKRYSPNPPKKQADQKLLDVICNWIRFAPKGTRQENCLKASYYAGGLSKMGQLNEQQALTALHQAAQDRGGEVDQSIRAINESFEQGKLRPIVNVSELDGVVRGMANKYVDPKSFLISSESIDEEAEMYYEGTYGDGILTGIADFDYYMSFRKNSFQFLVGGSKAGKTTLKLYLNTYLAVHHGLKTMAVCFENSAMEVQDEVIGFLTGNSAKYVYQTNRALYNKAKDFFKEHFAMLKVPPDMDFIGLTETCAQLNSQNKYFELWIDPIFKLPGTDDYAGNKLVARYAEPFANDVMGLFISMHARSSAQRDGGHIKDTDADFGVMYGNAADMTMAISRDFRDPEPMVRNTVLMSIDRIRSKKLKGGMETVKNCPIKWEYQWKEHNYDLWVPQPDDPDTYVKHKGGLLPKESKLLF